jgi:hypothetical protein
MGWDSTGLIYSVPLGSSGVLVEHGNEMLCPVKGDQYLNQRIESRTFSLKAPFIINW